MAGAAADALPPSAQLATWLALNEPDIFLTLARAVARGKLASAVRAHFAALGQDDGEDDFTDDSGDDSSGDFLDESADYSSFDTGSPLDVSGTATDSEAAAAAEFNLPAPTLEPVSTDTIDASLPSDVTSAIDATPTSSGSTVGSALSTLGQGIGSALASVGSALASPAGVKALGSVATAYYANQVAQANTETAYANAQTAQAVLAAQAATAASGHSLLPVSTTIDPATGLLQPVVSNGSTYTPTTLAGVASMLPAIGSQWGLWVALAAVIFGIVWVVHR